ncbi:Mrp/NBP35 family ATP-binding protein [Mesotoga sp.]|uniref:Mrp/NBP35 family ATP-binding protein n=2 Tax=Mesotoga TaxID=1184396 RepID=UPI000FF2A31A|nr:ATP-binding protein [Mesotoga sp. BH458_6_3_2_1]
MNPQEMAEAMEKIRNNVKSIKHKILVMSGKGGVGKSTVAVNLALALADEGFRTGLMDIDLHGPNVARMVGLKKQPEVIENQIFPPEVLPNLKVISISSFVEDDAPVVWRGPMKTTAIYQFLGDVAWGELDFLIIDSPPGTGDEPLTALQTLSDIMALVVTTPQAVAVQDVKRAINLVKTMHRTPLGIVENMSYMKCPNCGEVIKLFGEGGGKDLENLFDIPLLGSLPFDPALVGFSDIGKSIVTHMRGSELEAAYRETVKEIVQRVKL